MKNIMFYSYADLLFGYLVSLYENLFYRAEINAPSNPNHKLILDLTGKTDSNFSHTAGIYKTKGKTFFQKNLTYKYKNLKYRQLNNEVSSLKIINSLSTPAKANVFFPQVLKVVNSKNTLAVSYEAIMGKELYYYSKDFVAQSLSAILTSYDHISLTLSQKKRSLFPKRTTMQLAFLFPLYVLLAISKDPSHAGMYVKSLFVFYLFGAINLLDYENDNYRISHRDLHDKNILIARNKKIYVIDNEVTCLAEKYTDLAIASRYFYKKIGKKRTVELINGKIETQQDLFRFTKLSLYYTVQAIAIEKKTNRFYKLSLTYLTFLTTLIASQKLVSMIKYNYRIV